MSPRYVFINVIPSFSLNLKNIHGNSVLEENRCLYYTAAASPSNCHGTSSRVYLNGNPILFDLRHQALDSLSLVFTKTHAKPPGQSLDPVIFAFHSLENFRLPVYPSLHLVSKHGILPLDLLTVFTHDHQAAHKHLDKPATRILARKKVHQSEILSQELGLGKANVGHPFALRGIPDLIDPDTLGLVGKSGESISDQARLSWSDVWLNSILLESEWPGCAIAPIANIHLYIASPI